METSYIGKILRINLTKKSISVEDLNMEYAKKYIGGRGLGTRMLLDEIDPMVDPLSENNKLIIISGPLTGVKISTGTRYMVVTKSPLNNMIASSNSGGVWGSKLKYFGYDAIILEGKADKPTYISMKDGRIELLDATHLWGKETLEVEETLKGDDKNASVLNIGPAGENLSLMAAIMNDGDRAAARTGVGAVLGSKNLKAIVISVSTKQIDVYAEEEFKALSLKTAKQYKRHMILGNGLPMFGTPILLAVMNQIGSFPHKNWQEGFFDKYEQISGEVLTDKYLVKNAYCHGCTIGCGRIVKHNGKEVGGPEYETIWGFGGNINITSMEAIIEANYLCNEYGLDTISTSSTIACAMELYEKGLITEEECDGYPLEFGNEKSMIKWVDRIGKSEGKLGALMAQGSYALAKAYGREDLSMSVKKLEMPAYDPRGVQGLGVGFATANRGGCHVRGNTVHIEVMGLGSKNPPPREVTEGKAGLIKAVQDVTALIDSLGLCLFTSFASHADAYCEMFNLATGFNLTLEEFLQAGERIFSIERLFNQKAGMKPEEDTLPKRLLKEPLHNEYSEGMYHKLDQMLPEYYELRGWKEAFPTEETLRRLEIL